jgi:molybdate transport system substrate-binding protein
MRFLFFVLCAAVFLFGDVFVGIPGGYKNVFEGLIKRYNLKHSEKIEAVYGPMGVLMAQAKMGTLDIIFGDREKLQKNGFKKFKKIGYGKLVILSKRKIKSLKDLDSMKLIALPNPKGTIYGKAASEVFNKLNLHPRTLTVSLMPQGINYLKLNQCDAAVANKTQEIFSKGKFYSFEVPQRYYSPIVTGFCVLHKKNGTEKFIKFITSPKIKKYLQGFGI